MRMKRVSSRVCNQSLPLFFCLYRLRLLLVISAISERTGTLSFLPQQRHLPTIHLTIRNGSLQFKRNFRRQSIQRDYEIQPFSVVYGSALLSFVLYPILLTFQNRVGNYKGKILSAGLKRQQKKLVSICSLKHKPTTKPETHLHLFKPHRTITHYFSGVLICG